MAKELHDNLGVTVNVEALDFEHYLEQVGAAHEPTFWSLSWIADYPHAHDFLGLLLETGQHQQHRQVEQRRLRRADRAGRGHGRPGQQTRIYSQAQDILAHEVPVIPVSYDESWALSRTGLEGALSPASD